jgi:hypothetical protein
VAVGKASVRVPLAARVAAVLYLTHGLGFGIGTAFSLDHLRRHGELPMTPWGFRSLAGGPFDQLSAEQFNALGWALVGVCALDVVAGAWLWQGQRRGLALGIATAPMGFGLATAFALPFLLAGVPIRVALALAGRRGLRGQFLRRG